MRISLVSKFAILCQKPDVTILSRGTLCTESRKQIDYKLYMSEAL